MDLEFSDTDHLGDFGGRRWDEIWSGKKLHPDFPPVSLEQAMWLNGASTNELGRMETESWMSYVTDLGKEIGIQPGDSVFEVGCGAGGFLYPLKEELGVEVSGVDRSEALAMYSKRLIRDGEFAVADALSFDLHPPVDAVLSHGVFMYFPSREYVERAIDRMVDKTKVGGTVAILDVPNAERMQQDLEFRYAASGGPEAYWKKYDGLEQMYFHAESLAEALEQRGVTNVKISPQRMTDHRPEGFRINVWGTRSK